MKKPTVRVQLLGDGFSPKKLKERTKLPIESLVEFGEVYKNGRFKGKPSPYGFGYISVGVLNERTLEEYADKLIMYQSDLLENAVDEIVFDVYAPNKYIKAISVTPSFAGKLNELGARIEFTNSDSIEVLPNLKQSQKVISELSSLMPNFQKYSKLVNKLFKAIEEDDPHTISKLKEIL